MLYVNRVIVVIYCRPVVKIIRLLVFYQFHTFRQRLAPRAVTIVLCVQDVTVTVIDVTTVKLIAFQPQPGATVTDIVLTAATSLQDATTVSNLRIYLSTYQSIYLNICLDTEVVEALTRASAPSKRRTTTNERRQEYNSKICQNQVRFLMLCVSAVFAVARCPSVRPSLYLSRWCIVSRPLKISSNFFLGPVDPSL